MSVLKKELRIRYKTLRQQLSSDAIASLSETICNTLVRMDVWSYDRYHIFLPIETKKEVDTAPILSVLRQKHKKIVVPKMGADSSLRHFLLKKTTQITTNKWGVPEPQDGEEVTPQTIDLVFLPLLAFDTGGHRVGYGKGFYDRFLKNCRPDTLKVGLSFFEAEESILDVDTHDIPMDFCVTPQRMYRF